MTISTDPLDTPRSHSDYLPLTASRTVKGTDTELPLAPGNRWQEWMKAARLLVLTGVLAVMLSAARADDDIV